MTTIGLPTKAFELLETWGIDIARMRKVVITIRHNDIVIVEVESILSCENKEEGEKALTELKKYTLRELESPSYEEMREVILFKGEWKRQDGGYHHFRWGQRSLKEAYSIEMKNKKE